MKLPLFSHRLMIKSALCGLVSVLALAGCEEKVAGTSVGTGNPTEIQVSFRDVADAVVPLTGSMKVYASTQISLEAFSPAPLLNVDLTGTNHAALKAEAFKTLADSVWPKGSVSGDERSFNVVVTGQAQGAILRGFTFRKAKGDFILRMEDAKAIRDYESATIKSVLAPLVSLECALDTSSISARKDHYMFLYGTGFSAKGESGRFAFPSIPKGSHPVSFVSLPHKGDMGTGENDSLFVYSLNANAETGKQNPLTPELIQATLPIPESLKAK